MTLFQKTFLERVQKQGKNLILDDGRIGEFTIERTYELTSITANRLFDFGFRPGEAIIIKATRSASTVILFYACQFLGLVTVLCDYRTEAKDLYRIDPRIKGCAHQKDEAGHLLSWTIEKEGRSIELIVPETDSTPIEFEGVERIPNSDSVWVFTSGSEGGFKVVRHSQETLFSHCARYAKPSSCDETVGAMISLEEGADEKRVEIRIRESLPKIMWPEQIAFVSSLPLLPSGKVDRVKIKRELQGN